MSEPLIFRELRTGSLDLAQPHVDLTAIGTEGRTLLHEAIGHRRQEAAMRLIERGIPLNVQDDRGRTALHYAGIYEAAAIGTAILNAGGNPNIVDEHGNNALWAAALANNDDSFLSALVSHGADCHHKNRVGKSVYDFAQLSGDAALAKLCSMDAGSTRGD